MKKFDFKKLVIFLIAIMFALNVQAGYRKNVPQTVTQPNGRVLNLYATGDEYYHWMHDENNFTIVLNNENGYFCYANLVGDKLVATKYIVGEVNPQNVGLTAGINISAKQKKSIRQELQNKRNEMMLHSPSALSSSPLLTSTNSGLMNNIVIYIRFADDQEFTVEHEHFSTVFNSKTPETVSMFNYFNEVSYGQLKIETQFYPKNNGRTILSYQDAHNRNYYRKYIPPTNGGGGNKDGYTSDAEQITREHILLKKAVDFVSSQIPADAQIDMNNDGLVDAVGFIVAGQSESWSDLLWPHQWSLFTQYAYINGKRVYEFDFLLEKDLNGSDICHEMFHVLGAPDLYHYNDQSSTLDPVGEWDIMASNSYPPQHMTQYMKWKYGKWIADIPEIKETGDYVLNPVTNPTNNGFRIASPFSPSEYFVVEYRKKEKFDKGLPGEGLLVYRINSSLDGYGNSDGPPDELYIYRVNGSLTEDGILRQAFLSDKVGRTSISDNANPNAFLSNGGKGGLNISNVMLKTDGTISFHYEAYQQAKIDAGISYVVSPLNSNNLKSNEIVKVLVANFGTSPITQGLTISYKVNGGEAVTENFPNTLPENTTVEFTFRQPIDISNSGAYKIEIYTSLAGDLKSENDKMMTVIINPIPLEYRAENAITMVGTYTELTANDGTIISVSNTDDANSAPISFPSGFTFNYCGISYNKFILNTNGFIKLGDVFPSTAALYFRDAQTVEGGVFNSADALDINIIAPFNHNLTAAAKGSEYRISASGVAPNRIVTIQFKGLKDKAVTDNPSQYDEINFQIKLYETSNIIEFVYGTWTPSLEISKFKHALCGLKGLGNMASQLLAVSKGSTMNWSDVSFANSNYQNTSAMNFGNPPERTTPEFGRTFRFLPTVGVDIAVVEILNPKSSCDLTNAETITARVKNMSGQTINGFKMSYKLDKNAEIVQSFTTVLAPYASAVVNFSQKANFNIKGTHYLIVNALISSDIDVTNNSDTTDVINIEPLTLPFKEDFEGTFPNKGWNIENPDRKTTWEKHELMGSLSGTHAAYINFYNYEKVAQKDALLTPTVLLSGQPKLKFDISYSGYPEYFDTLKVYMITACGKVEMLQPLFVKGGLDLATVAPMENEFTPSKPEEWKTILIDLKPFAGQSVRFKFVGVNNYGNNLYVDNVEVLDFKEGEPVVDFNTAKTTVFAYEPVKFNDQSSGLPNKWIWTLPGTSIGTTEEQNPIVTYTVSGSHDVSLVAYNDFGKKTAVKTNYITVLPQKTTTMIPPVALSSSENPSGPASTYKYHRMSTLYPYNEISLIDGYQIKYLDFNLAQGSYKGVSGNLKVYLALTGDQTYNKTNKWTDVIANMTMVYDGNVNIPTSQMFYGVMLNSPFAYAANKGVYLAFEWTATSPKSDLDAIYATNVDISQSQSLYYSVNNNEMPATLDNGDYARPQIRVGTDAFATDAEIVEIYTLGQLPINTMHEFSVAIKNVGRNAISDSEVSISVSNSGTSLFQSTIKYSAVLGETVVVSFPQVYFASTGVNDITVTLAKDDNIQNNTKIAKQLVTDNTFSYNLDVPTVSNNWGSAGALTYLSKYHITGSKVINKVGTLIGTDPSNIGKTLYAVVSDDKGDVLGTSPSYYIQTGDLGNWHDFDVKMDFVKDKDILAGIAKSGEAAYYPFPVENENPARSNTYYKATTADLRDLQPETEQMRYINRITVSDFVSVTSIKLEPSATTMKVGETITIKPTISPTDASIQTVTYESSDTKIVTVDEKGMVKALAIGEATIKVISDDKFNGIQSQTATVQVIAGKPVTGITCETTATVKIDQTHQLVYNILPTDATNKRVVFTSDNEDVAMIDNEGVIYGIAAGSTKVNVTTEDGSHTASCTVVVPQILVNQIVLNIEAITLYSSEISVLSAVVLPANATNPAYNWTSSNPSIATVDNDGVVTAEAAGIATITATATDGSNVKGQCTVTVTAKINVTAITLDLQSVDLEYNPTAPNTVQLTATLEPANPSNSNIYWVSDNPSIASIDENGLVTGVSIGSTYVYAVALSDATGKTYTYCLINVNPINISDFTILPTTNADIILGTPMQFSVASFLPDNATNKVITWFTSDAAIASISPTGLVVGNKIGTATITATSVSDPLITKTCMVNVKNGVDIGSVALNKSYLELPVSGTFTLSATVLGTNTSDIVNQEVTWLSSSPTVNVSETGFVTGLVKSGNIVTITATSVANNTITATCSVKVVTSVSSITLDKATKKLALGQAFDLVATIAPLDADNKDIMWQSSNPNFVLVDANGHVYGAFEGSAVIKATSQSDESKVATCQVFVDNTKPILTLLGNAVITLNYGDVYTDAGATASDNLDGNITANIQVVGSVNTSIAGTYTLVYKVSDAVGNIANEVSRTVTVLKGNQTITFADITKKYGDAEFALTATTNANGMTISYKSDNTAVAEVLNGKIVIKGIGTANITASQAGNENFNAAADVVKVLTVNKATLTVTADNKTMVYKTTMPTLTATYTGFVYNESASIISGTCELATIATTTSPASDYDIIVTQGTLTAANYNFNFVKGKLSITKADQTITFGALTAIAVGSSDLDPQAKASSGLGIIYTSSNTSVATIISNKVHAVAAGTTEITATQIGDNNYTAAAPVKQNLVVNWGTGFSESIDSQFKVYPNPSRGKFVIEIPSEISTKTTMLVRDINGRTILAVNDCHTLTTIDIENQAKGLYFLIIRSDNNEKTLKLMVE